MIPPIITTNLTFILVRVKTNDILYERKYLVKFWHVWKCFLISKVVLIDLWNFRTGRELSWISSFCIYGNTGSEKPSILARVARVTFHVLSWSQWLSALFFADAYFSGSLSISLWWYLVLQSIGRLKVQFHCLAIMLLAVIALNILYKLSIYIFVSLLWSWFNLGNWKKIFEVF